MHYPIVFITESEEINKINLKNINLVINAKEFVDNYQIIDENTLKFRNGIIYFDILIINSKEILHLDFFNHIYKDNMIPVTNCFHQTSIENIFSIGYSSTSAKPINIQLNEIFDFLNE